jgi:ATP-dependent DNA ligase
VQRDGKRVRLFTRNGHDWSGRFPLITEVALRNRNTSFVIDGEAVLLGHSGIAACEADARRMKKPSPVCTENPIGVDDAPESPKLAE